MIGDNTNGKDLLKKMHHQPNTYFLFDPKSHFTNAQTLYMAMKKHINEKFYGRKKKALADESGPPKGNPNKGTPLENCQLPYELFNVNRMIKMNSKQMLSRMGFLTLRDGTLEIQGKNKPEIPELKGLLQTLEEDFDMPSTFDKPDFFSSFTFMEGVISAENMKTNGIRIKCLEDKIIYPLYGVWSPTN